MATDSGIPTLTRFLYFFSSRHDLKALDAPVKQLLSHYDITAHEHGRTALTMHLLELWQRARALHDLMTFSIFGVGFCI